MKKQQKSRLIALAAWMRQQIWIYHDPGSADSTCLFRDKGKSKRKTISGTDHQSRRRQKKLLGSAFECTRYKARTRLACCDAGKKSDTWLLRHAKDLGASASVLKSFVRKMKISLKYVQDGDPRDKPVDISEDPPDWKSIQLSRMHRSRLYDKIQQGVGV